MLPSKLSLHVLTKNEEGFIYGLLSRVAPHVHEIIVTDTGSVDGTVEEALNLGARVCHTTMERGFGEARNVGLAFVTTPWVLQIDADELPTVRLLSWIAYWQPLQGTGGVWIRRHNLVGKQPIGKNTYEWHPRIFRSGYRFAGALHERPIAPYETFIRAPDDCLLLHYKTIVRQERQNAFYATFNAGGTRC